MDRTLKAIVAGTVVAGTLDLLIALGLGYFIGQGAGEALRGIASGPFGPAMVDGGVGAALVGLVTHYAIMAVMVTVFVVVAGGWTALTRQPVAAGIGYGVILYLVMHWLVLPGRFPGAFPQTGAWQVAGALFSHCVGAGLPIAAIARGYLRRLHDA